MNEAPDAGTGDNTLTGGFTPGESAAPTEQGQAPAAPTSWHSEYSNDFQSLMDKKGLSDLSQQDATEALAKSYTNLESMRNVPGENLFNISTDMTDETRDSVYSAMGRPESADKYSYANAESDSPELNSVIKTAAHELGLTDKQVSGLMPQINDEIAQLVNDSQTATNDTNTQGLTELAKEWGGAYQSNINLATRAADHFGITEEMQQAIVSSGQSAGFLKALNTMGGLMAEGQMAGMSPQSGSAAMGVMTPEQATSEINSKLGDKDFMARYHSQNQATRVAASKELEPFRRAQTGK
jgi:hypothetical protein